MSLNELLLKNRSYRRFHQDETIDTSILKEMVENARISPSPSNLQPLKFIIVNDPEINRKIFPLLKWAGFLKSWIGPEEGERPSAYILLLGNRKINTHLEWDYGIALQTILLTATEKGFGGCAIASCDRDKLQHLLEIPKNLEIGCVVSLGKPKEKVVLEEVKDNDIKYWRDEDEVHHVPKRSLDDLILKIVSG
jgi:nitroreductase